MTTRISLVKKAHKIVAANLPAGGTAIDATVGNGYDTVFLAERVGKEGLVYGFDIQQTALESARTRLEQAGLLARVNLKQAGHETMLDHLGDNPQNKINTVMFNLGYLPGQDKTVITRTNTTLEGLNAAVQLISTDGLITVIAYPGHEGGKPEMMAIIDWFQQLGKLFVVDTIYLDDRSPRLFAITKRDYC